MLMAKERKKWSKYQECEVRCWRNSSPKPNVADCCRSRTEVVCAKAQSCPVNASNIHAAVRVCLAKPLRPIAVVAVAIYMPMPTRPAHAIESHHSLNVGHNIIS
jgi:hypothetical protein